MDKEINCKYRRTSVCSVIKKTIPMNSIMENIKDELNGIELELVKHGGATLKVSKDIKDKELVSKLKGSIKKLVINDLDQIDSKLLKRYHFGFDESLISDSMVKELFDISYNSKKNHNMVSIEFN